MRTLRSIRTLLRAVLIAVITAASLSTPAGPAHARVVSEEAIMTGYSGGLSRSIVAAESPGGITVWDRSTDTSVVVQANPVRYRGCMVGGDLVVWLEGTAENSDEAAALLCYNARTGEPETLTTDPADEYVTDGRYVVFDTTGPTLCWDSLTQTTRTVPTTGGLWHADMRDGLLVWVDDVRSIPEGSEPDTGLIRAWDAGTGRLTRVTPGRAAVEGPKTDGHQVAWSLDGTQAGTTQLWDPETGITTVPGMMGDLVFDHGVLIGLASDRTTFREPSGAVRVLRDDNPHPDHADYSDGLLSGAFWDETDDLRAIDVYTSVADTLTAAVTNKTRVAAAADLIVSSEDSVNAVPVDLARMARPIRLEGRSRFDVSVQTAEAAYPRWKDVRHVVIASGDDRAAADPLAAAGLSWRYDAPLMLVSARQAPASVRAAVREIVHNNGPVTVHVVGGTTSVPDAVVAQIKATAGADKVTIDRVAAPNRYTLAAAIARRVAEEHDGELPAALIANGADSTKFFDAAALSAIAAAQGYPVLLVERDRVPAATAAFLNAAEPADVVVAGGRATVSDGVVRSVGAERWAGADRYATAAAIAANATDPDRAWLRPDVAGIAAMLPDALSGGAVTGRQGGPLLLSTRTSLPSATANWLSAHTGEIEGCWVLGGADSVWSRVLSEASARAFE